MTRYLLTHPEMGTYIGNALGLGFWSKLDPVGQDAAVTFDSFDDAWAHARTWDGGCEGVEPYCLLADESAYLRNGPAVYAPIAVCVAAGLQAWDPGPYAQKSGT